MNELEFVELTEGFDDSSANERYYVETNFGGLAFFSDTVFYIYYASLGNTDYYQLVGKTIENLIAENSIVTN